MRKRIFAILLCLALCFSLLPAGAHADDAVTLTYNADDGTVSGGGSDAWSFSGGVLTLESGFSFTFTNEMPSTMI